MVPAELYHHQWPRGEAETDPQALGTLRVAAAGEACLSSPCLQQSPDWFSFPAGVSVTVTLPCPPRAVSLQCPHYAPSPPPELLPSCDTPHHTPLWVCGALTGPLPTLVHAGQGPPK